MLIFTCFVVEERTITFSRRNLITERTLTGPQRSLKVIAVKWIAMISSKDLKRKRAVGTWFPVTVLTWSWRISNAVCNSMSRRNVKLFIFTRSPLKKSFTIIDCIYFVVLTRRRCYWSKHFSQIYSSKCVK